MATSIKLSNGQKTEIKRLGAVKQARALAAITSVLDNEALRERVSGMDFSGGDSAANAIALAGAAGNILANNLDALFELAEMFSELSREDFERDGDDALTIQDAFYIFKAAIQVNQFDAVFTQLGNALAPFAEDSKADGVKAGKGAGKGKNNGKASA